MQINETKSANLDAINLYKKEQQNRVSPKPEKLKAPATTSPKSAYQVEISSNAQNLQDADNRQQNNVKDTQGESKQRTTERNSTYNRASKISK